ncbi:MAG: TIGR01777 family oxidoreductase [Myxococcota bacterium]
MRVIITGGTGFIGQNLVRTLLDSGNTPVVSTRNIEQARTKLGPDVQLVQTSDDAELVKAISGSDGVVNLAGEPVLPARWTPEKKKRLVSSRVDFTQRIVSSIQNASERPKVLVSASAVGFYGHAAGGDPKTETADPAADFLAQLCVDWEAAAQEAEALDVRVCRVRIGLVLGEDGGALSQMLTPFKMGVGGKMGSGRQYMPWIHVEDLVRMILAALENESFPSVVNGTAPTPVTNSTFTSALGRVLNRPTFVPVPAFALKAMFGEAAVALLGGQNAVPAAAQSHGFDFRFADLDACLRDILI